MRDGRNGEYSPTVYLISVHEVDTVYNCGGCGSRQAAALNRLAMDNATQDYIETHRPGFQQSEKPQFVFASKNNRFSFSLGGFVSLRAGYDFDGIVDNIDFVPYDIPVPGNYNSKQKLMMDASTSRLFMKAITNTRALGRVVIYMDADFRGGAEGSYTPRLRSAYVSFKGLTLGRDAPARARLPDVSAVCVGRRPQQPYPRVGRHPQPLHAQGLEKFDHLAARLGRAVQRYDQVLRLVPALHERRLRRGHHPLYSGPDGFGARLHAITPTTSTSRGSISSATSSIRSRRAARWPASTSTVRART